MHMNRIIKNIRLVSVFLLLFNGLNAIGSGWFLMTDPTGVTLGMSTVFLEHSPFNNFLIPGIILFVAIGLFSIAAAVFAILRSVYYAKLVFFQGIILTGWIIIQMMLLRRTNFLHILFGAIGILLVVFGIVLEESPSKNQVNR